jgi:uncharacterized membrane protein HdeD (DUF308 family)
VTIVAALAVLFGAYLIIDGGLTLSGAASDDTERIVDGSLQVGLGLLALVIVFGPARMREWAWKLFMTLVVVGLTIQILRHLLFGDPRYARMATTCSPGSPSS